MSAITTHVLDLSTGRPAAGVEVTLEIQESVERWLHVGHGVTDADGRLRTLTASDGRLTPGTYRLQFHTRTYFDRSGTRSFYPQIAVVFEVTADESHYHVPLLVSPYGYSTYRGS
jgi:5-hydroxyisourate hydrolase